VNVGEDQVKNVITAIHHTVQRHKDNWSMWSVFWGPPSFEIADVKVKSKLYEIPDPYYRYRLQKYGFMWRSYYDVRKYDVAAILNMAAKSISYPAVMVITSKYVP